MADTKNYGLTGVGTELEFGIDGPKLVKSGNTIETRTNDGTALVELKSATPTTDDSVVTKGYLERTVNVVVTGQIDGGAPPAVVNGAIYICTTTGGTYTQEYLYRGESGVWVEIVPFAGMKIAVTVPLTGGAIEYLGDHVYLWDADASDWLEIGPYVSNTAKVVKSERADLAFNTASPLNIGSPVPANGRPFRVIVNVTQAFNATGPALSIGDSINTSRLMTTGEVNLKKVGIYVADCYYNYASATQIIGTFVQGTGGSAGQAQIEYVYTQQ